MPYGMTKSEISRRAQSFGLSIPDYLALLAERKGVYEEGELKGRRKPTALEAAASRLGTLGRLNYPTRSGSTAAAPSMGDLLGLDDLLGGGGGYRPQTAEEAESLRAQAALARARAGGVPSEIALREVTGKLYGAQAADIPLARELARRTFLAETGVAQAERAANPRRMFEALYAQARLQPTELAKSLDQKMNIPGLKGGGTVAHPGFAAVAKRIARERGVSGERARAILASSTRGASAAAKRRNPRLKRVPGAAQGKAVEGPVVIRVGEDGEEYALLMPGSVVAPKPEGEEPTIENATHHIADQMAKGGVVSKAKAREILAHGEVHGEPLTEKQRGLFGLIAGGGKPTRLKGAQGGLSLFGLPPEIQELFESIRKEATGVVSEATGRAVRGTSLFDPLGGSTFTPGQSSFLSKLNLRSLAKLSPTQSGALASMLSANRVDPEDYLASRRRQFEGFNPVAAGTRTRFSGVLGRR